jgi:hypothetical protein
MAMDEDRDQRFMVSSLGTFYRASLEMFAHHLETVDGKKIKINELNIDQPFFVIFQSGTGFTRTSAVRLL